MSQSNPLNESLAYVKAFSKVLSEKIEEEATHAFSNWGKFEAEQRENLRQFLETVQHRAKQELDHPSTHASTASVDSNEDLQETLDELRAEIARLRAELKNYSSQAED